MKDTLGFPVSGSIAICPVPSVGGPQGYLYLNWIPMAGSKCWDGTGPTKFLGQLKRKSIDIHWLVGFGLFGSMIV